MSAYVGRRVLKQEEKEARHAQLQAMVDQIRAERKEKKRRKKERKRRRKKVGFIVGVAGLVDERFERECGCLMWLIH